MPLTSHERIMRIFRNQEVDRPALKLWGAELDPFLLHPDYAPVRQRALEVTDLFVGSGSPFHIFFGQLIYRQTKAKKRQLQLKLQKL